MSTEQMLTLNVMEEPKAPVGVFELPCGWLDPTTQELVTTVELREITGREEDMLASSAVPSEHKMNQLLGGCITRIGEVTDRGRVMRIVEDLPIGDRVFLLFAIRRVSLGDEFPLRDKCPECGTQHLFVLDLKELKIQQMPEPRKRVYDTRLPTGRQVTFRISTGKDEARIARIQRKGADQLSQSILMRLETLDGEPPTLGKVQDLSLKDRHFLRDSFNEVEGGVDTAVQLDCPSCHHEWEKDLSVAASSFFSPSAEQKRSKKRSSG